MSGVLLECNNAGSAFQHVLKLLTSVALIVVYSAAGLWMSWEVTVGMLVLGVLLTVVLQGQIRTGEDLGTRKTTVNSRFQNVIGESLDSAKLIKGSSLENLAVGLILDEAEQLADIERNVHIKHAKLRVLGEPLIVAVLCFAVYAAIVLLNLHAAVLLTLIYIFFRLFPKILATQQTYFQALVYILSFARIEQLIDDAEASREVAKDHGVVFSRLKAQLTLEDVSYTYRRGPLAIDRVSLAISRGETVGITGASGAGKSTIADLILGLLQPQSGMVSVDSVALTDFDLRSWRQRIGYVSGEQHFQGRSPGPSRPIPMESLGPSR